MTRKVFQQGPPRVKITCHKYRSSKIPFSRHSSIYTCCSILRVCVCVCARRICQSKKGGLVSVETLKKCAPPPPVFNHLCMWCVCVCVKKVEGITQLTPFKMHTHPPFILPCNSFFIFSLSSFLFSPIFSFQVQQTEELPRLSSNLSGELFPRVETLPSFFSPLSPLPPFISVK